MGYQTSKRWVSAFRRPLMAAMSVLALLCVPVISNAGISAASKCNPLAEDTCGLPFPSDVFRTAGGHYGFSDKILDRRIDGDVRTLLPASFQFPSSFQPSKIFNGSTGFSALGPVLFELNDWPRQSIPSDGEGHLHVYNMETGERVPMIVSLSGVADVADVREDRPVIIAWPRARLEFGEKYVAILFKAPFDEGAGATDVFRPSEGVQDALEGKAGWVLNYVYETPLESIDALNIARDSILSFTWFTVKSKTEVTEPMQHMVDTALAYPSFIKNLKVGSEFLGDADYGLVTLTGEVGLMNFRSEDGGVHEPYDNIPDLSRSLVEFVLTLPQWAASGPIPIPIAVWGHGLGNFKELTRTIYEISDRLGMAAIAIDHPNHGSRVSTDSLDEPSIAVAASTPATIMHLLGMFVQATVDHTVVINVSKNILPGELAKWSDPRYPAVPTLDGSRVMYDGMSLGAMVGVAIGAVAPELEGAYLVNGAGSLMQVFTESTFWDYFTSNVVPQNMNGAEATFVVAMMQHYLDIADGNNFVDRYREPLEGNQARPLGMHYALQDGSVPNSASLATAELADLPLLKDVSEPVPTLRYGTEGRDGFENGYGLVQAGLDNLAINETLASLDGLGIDDTLGLDIPDGFLSFLDLDTDAFGLDSNYTDWLESSLGLDTGNVTGLLDFVYDGELDGFAQHFNRTSVFSLHKQVDWRCEVLNLEPSRCTTTKQLIEDDAEREANGDYSGYFPAEFGDYVDNISGNPMDDVTNVINEGLENVNVTDGSAGSLEWIMLIMLSLLFVASLLRKPTPQKVPVRIDDRHE